MSAEGCPLSKDITSRKGIEFLVTTLKNILTSVGEDPERERWWVGARRETWRGPYLWRDGTSKNNYKNNFSLREGRVWEVKGETISMKKTSARYCKTLQCQS